MESVELVVSAKTMTRIFVFILYVPICLFVYWRLIPRLSTTSKRLASFMLVAQVLVIVVSMEIRPASDFERWLWDLGKEWNIPGYPCVGAIGAGRVRCAGNGLACKSTTRMAALLSHCDHTGFPVLGVG